VSTVEESVLRVARGASLVLGACVAAAGTAFAGGGTTPDPGARELDDSACGSDVPEPRFFPQVAYFFTEEPIRPYGLDRYVQRGFLVYGGMDPSSDFDDPEALSDIWLYDLSTVDVASICRWIRLQGDSGAAGGRFGGAMAYVDSVREFVVVGGFVEETYWVSRADEQALYIPLDTLATWSYGLLFSGSTSLDLGLEYAISEMGNPACGELHT
jgi:hypothetical protein